MKVKAIAGRGWKSGKFEHELGMVNTFFGPNGSGKTSAMDAIRLCLFGEIPGLGKQNRSLMKGATGSRVWTSAEMDDGSERVVELVRKGESVQKTNSEEFISSSIPLSVAELLSLSGEEFRSLLSMEGEVYQASDFLNAVASEAPVHSRAAISRCNVKGEGDLKMVSEWVREISQQKSREQSNVRETSGALANTRKMLEDTKPVPPSVVQKWEKELASLTEEKRQAEDNLAECRKDEDRAINSRRDLNAVAVRLQAAQEDARHFAKHLSDLMELHREDWGESLAGDKNKEAARLREEAESAMKESRMSNNARTAITEINERLKGIIERAPIEEKHKLRITEARDILQAVHADLPKGQIETASMECAHILEKAARLEMEAREILLPKENFNNALARAGVTSLSHASERAERAKNEAALIQQEHQQKEKELVAYEGESVSSLTEKVNELEEKCGDLRKKISGASEFGSLKDTESGLIENLQFLEDALEDMKSIEKAAIKVQAEMLERPVRQLEHDLDCFSEAMEFKQIRASFEKQGRTTTLAIRLVDGFKEVPIEAVSGGERLLVGCAFLYAINRAKTPESPMIFVEAAELDSENAGKLLKGLEYAGSQGIQCFMTSFEPIGSNPISVCQEAVVHG